MVSEKTHFPLILSEATPVLSTCFVIFKNAVQHLEPSEAPSSYFYNLLRSTVHFILVCQMVFGDNLFITFFISSRNLHDVCQRF